MKAMVMTAQGMPDVLALRELPPPTVSGGHELLVRLKAAGVNPVDTKLRARGTYFPERMPAILGCDGAGVVEATGTEVQRYRPGDAVYFCSGGIGSHPGTYAQYAVIDERLVAPKPRSLSYAAAAAARRACRHHRLGCGEGRVRARTRRGTSDRLSSGRFRQGGQRVEWRRGSRHGARHRGRRHFRAHGARAALRGRTRYLVAARQRHGLEGGATAQSQREFRIDVEPDAVRPVRVTALSGRGPATLRGAVRCRQAAHLPRADLSAGAGGRGASHDRGRWHGGQDRADY